MNLICNYPVCTGCKHSSLFCCNKYNEECVSVYLDKNRHQLICNSCLNNDGYEYGTKIFTSQQNFDDSKIALFRIPGPENLDIFIPILEMLKYYPEVFYENRKISEIYGSFCGAIWNGRTSNYNDKVMPIQQLEKIRDTLELYGLSMNLTWNNHLISGTDIYDKTCNAITKVFHNGKHSITVASLELFNYLKKEYPNFTYYQSIIPTTNDTGYIKQDDKFDIYVINRKLNNNWDELLKIPKEDRENIEFLCNDGCTPICNRMTHYNIINKNLLNREQEDKFLINYCTIDHDFMGYNTARWPITINPDQIDKYLENGFHRFKLCSRGDAQPILLYKTLKYLVKPEYLEDVLAWGLTGVYQPEIRRKAAEKCF